MAILNQKERILDIVLTDRGREQLSKNQLNFTYYAFSDEGVDYSGSLSASLAQSSSLDDYIHRGLSFEATQRVSDFEGSKAGPTRLDLNSFLYTVPAGSKVLPEFVASVDEDVMIVPTRRFTVDNFALYTRGRNRIVRPVAVIMRGTVSKKDLSDRLYNYVQDQRYAQTRERVRQHKTIVGLPIGKDLIAMSRGRALNTVTGAVLPITREMLLNPGEEDLSSMKKEVEIVMGLGNTNIDFNLKTSEGAVPALNGYLIQVYESGSDGKLKEINEKSTEDPLTDETIRDGYNSYFRLRVR